MKYSKEAEAYINGEHIRLLVEDNKIPTLEERVMSAFDAGMSSVTRSFSNLDCFSSNKGKINFPNYNE
jgi:hypothetical protein